MTVSDLKKFLESLIEQNKGNYPVYFDTEARTFEYHLAEIGYAAELPAEVLGSEVGMVTLHEVSYTTTSPTKEDKLLG